jgi:hypothetical protein
MMKGKRADSLTQLPYKMEMQKKGISLGATAQHPVPMKANPVVKQDPGLGATTISHPFKAGKPTI